MAELSLDRSRTALLIADFYGELLRSLPHAVDRRVVEKPSPPPPTRWS